MAYLPLLLLRVFPFLNKSPSNVLFPMVLKDSAAFVQLISFLLNSVLMIPCISALKQKDSTDTRTFIAKHSTQTCTAISAILDFSWTMT